MMVNGPAVEAAFKSVLNKYLCSIKQLFLKAYG